MLGMPWESIYSLGLIMSSAYHLGLSDKSEHNVNGNILGSVPLWCG